MSQVWRDGADLAPASNRAPARPRIRLPTRPMRRTMIRPPAPGLSPDGRDRFPRERSMITVDWWGPRPT